MSKGFGRRFWLQLIFLDSTEEWIPWGGDYKSAVAAVAVKMAVNPQIDCALILAGKAKEREAASTNEVLADFQREAEPGRKKLNPIIRGKQ